MINQRNLRVVKGEQSVERSKLPVHRRRVLWSMVIFLVLIGVGVVVRRTVHLVPILISGYTPPIPSANPALAQFAATASG